MHAYRVFPVDLERVAALHEVIIKTSAYPWRQGKNRSVTVSSVYYTCSYCQYLIQVLLWTLHLIMSLILASICSFYNIYGRLTSSICISQLPADHSSIRTTPKIITHCSPGIVNAHLHPPLILGSISYQLKITICAVATWNYCRKIIFETFSGFSVGLCVNEEKVIWYQLELGK